MKRRFGLLLTVLVVALMLPLSSCTTAGFYTSADGTFFRGENGQNVTGWLTHEGERYCFDDEGKMLFGGIFEHEGERYLFDDDGKLTTGFKVDGLSVLYFTPEGPMAKDFTYVDGELYYFRPDTGAMVTGFLTVGGKFYFFAEDGKAHRGFLESDGTLHYFSDDGPALTGFQEIDGGVYYFDDEGFDVGTGLISTPDGVLYITEERALFTGPYEDGDAAYFFQDGRMVTDAFVTFEGDTYRFGGDGKKLFGWQEIDGNRYHFNKLGVLSKSTTVDGYPIDENGVASEPTAPPKVSAAIGDTTGNSKLDDAVKKVLDEICDLSMSDTKKLAAVFDWMVNKMKYKYVSVDLSNGYTDELVASLAEYAVLNRRGSCEHQAALTAVFIERLGFSSIVVKGDFLSDDKTEWVEHAWVIAEVGGSYYHFDPLFGRNHTSNPRSFFMKKDADIEALHQWVREDYPACT